MKKLIFISILFFVTLVNYGQTDCNPPLGLSSDVSQYDVQLTWNAPDSVLLGSFSNSNTTPSIYSESSGIVNKTINRSSREYLDVQFSWETHHNTGEAGVACDGEFIYSTTWNDVYIFKYDLVGNFLDTITIPGVNQLRNLVYCETDGYFYGSTVTSNSGIYILDFENDTIIDHIPVTSTEGARALGYDSDLDVFYTNNWGTDVLVVDRASRTIVDTLELNSNSASIYGFAYDNVSYGGPYLWAFCQDNNGTDLVQLTLPGLTETGVVLNIMTLIPGSNGGLAGGLFIQPGIVDTTVTLGGLVQNEIIFGLELGYYSPLPPTVMGYNIYRDSVKIDSVNAPDTVYYDLGLPTGTYNYYVTAVYGDIDGNITCESDPSNIVEATISDPDYILGGNVFAGSVKLDQGAAHAYSIDDESITYETSVDIDDLGYYFFLEFAEKDYFVYTVPDESSNFAGSFIPTYYGDVYHWEDSPTIYLNQNLYNQDINLVEINSMIGTGTGIISGMVYQESKGFNESPAEDILVLLLNGDNECVKAVYTNISGIYEFNNLENGTYHLLCEIIGKKTEKSTYIISDENQAFTNINFMIKSDQIVLGLDDELPSNIKFISDIFPNPASNYAQLEINASAVGKIEMSIYNSIGKVVYYDYRQLNIGVNSININLSETAPGMKLMKIEFENGTSITRKFLTY